MAYLGNSQFSPPAKDDIEVSLFGPGFGECVVVHLGFGDWAVVDSCMDPESKRPAALQYLESVGVSVGISVRLVIGTHWHDDHMQGISSVFRPAKGAVFACTGAVRQPDFNEVLGAWTGTRFLAGGSGIDELHSVFEELRQRQPHTHYPAPRLASANKVVWERLTEPIASVKALSPSDAAVLATIARLRSVTPKSSSVRRRIPNLKPERRFCSPLPESRTAPSASWL